MQNAFDNSALSKTQTEVFVASFSAASDLKSQWIDYAGRGEGIAIGFDLERVRPPAELQYAITLAPCIYRGDEKRRLLGEAIGRFVNVTEQLYVETADERWIARRLSDWRRVDRIYGSRFDQSAFEALIEEQLKKDLTVAHTESSFDLLRLASHCKHEGFSEEKEWRLALPHTIGTPLLKDRVLRRGDSEQIPYVAHDLFSSKLPIAQVKIGPLCRAAARVEDILKDHHLSVSITKSEIPLRTMP